VVFYLRYCRGASTITNLSNELPECLHSLRLSMLEFITKQR